ncbi:hypothetical protein [Nonomuraea lactucae]|uniref:hypothetical protein n=1 Tax=Nonomuraea lactucae TaxID=2249762 RepID=UPI0013B4130C|nr:hypothetical protein [Nonomuraea lactucae]
MEVYGVAAAQGEAVVGDEFECQPSEPILEIVHPAATAPGQGERELDHAVFGPCRSGTTYGLVPA